MIYFVVNSARFVEFLVFHGVFMAAVKNVKMANKRSRMMRFSYCHSTSVLGGCVQFIKRKETRVIGCPRVKQLLDLTSCQNVQLDYDR